MVVEETQPGTGTLTPGHRVMGEALLSTSLLRGSSVGRYLVLRELGRGGLGVVYAAFDPELDRRVALKLLGGGDEGIQRELSREARVLAKFSHQNVATVYDAGVSEGVAYLAMELAEGGDLCTWLEAEARTPEEILAAFVEAGRGLAAAHALGIVHRDFKPRNVLVGADGHMRVGDFGLAQLVRGAEEGVGPGGELRALEQTRPGAGGTPAFMAPELARGDEADARSDQYAFCVSLVWALTGSMPRTEELSPGALLDPETALALREVGDRVYAATVQGLDPDPARRHASMEALLSALEPRPDPGSPSRWGLVAGTLAVLAGGALWGLTSPRPRPPSLDRCALAGETLAAVWNPARAEAVDESLGASLPAGAEMAEPRQRVRAGLDAYARDWAAAQARGCALPQASARRGQVLRCLDRRLGEADALVAALVEGAATVDASVVAVTQLSRPAGCDEAAWHPPSRVAEAPMGERAAVADGRRALERAKAYELTGQYPRSFDEASEILAGASELGYRPLEAEAGYILGMAAMEQGHYEQAVDILRGAFSAAVAAGHDEILVCAGSLLVYALGSSLGDSEGARLWIELTAAGLERWGEGTYVEAIYLDSVSATALHRGELEPAREAAERSLELRQASLPPDHPELAYALMAVATVEFEARDWAESEGHARAALELRERAFGPGHPDLISPLTSVAGALSEQGRFEDALVALERALAIGEARLGAEHPRLDGVRNNLATARNRQGDHAEAKLLYERVLTSWIAARGEDDPMVGLAHHNLGSTAGMLGELELAWEHHERAAAIWSASLGPDHIKLVLPLNGLAADALALGRCEQARGEADQAWALITAADGKAGSLEARVANTRARISMCLGDTPGAQRAAAHAVEVGRLELGESHPRLGRFYVTLAKTQLVGGELEAAQGAAERGLDLAQRGTPGELGEAQLVLAQVLAARGEGEQAQAQARAALGSLPDANRRWASEREAARALLKG